MASYIDYDIKIILTNEIILEFRKRLANILAFK